MLLRAPPTLHYLNGATADENFGRSLFSSSSVSTPSPRVCMAVKGGSSNSRPLAAVVFKPFGEVKMEISLVPSVPQQSLARQKYANEQIKFVISRAKRKSSRQVFPNLISCLVEESRNEGSSGSDETTPGATIDLKLPRRSLLLHFTCNSCGERSKKLINRLAYEKGTVFVQIFSLTSEKLITLMKVVLS